MIRITEATGAAPPVTGRTQLVTLITPGWGSSGYYSAEALQQAVRDGVWPRGTKMYIDHPTMAETHDRPERSLQTLAASLVEDAVWNAAESAVQAKVRVFPRWRDDLAEMAEAEAIGVSIYTLAESEPGEAEGRSGMLVKRLVPDPHNTVDYVTVPGRGGRVSAVLESAREATHNSVRDQLRSVLQAKYAADEGTYAFILDSDDTHVWFELDQGEASTTWQQPYSLQGETVTLQDSPLQVIRKITWEPVAPQTEGAAEEIHNDSPTAPAGGDRGKESDMSDITIDEAELTQLRESSGRAAQLEKELEELRTERAAEAQAARVARAEDAVRSAFGEDAPAFYLESARRAAAEEGYDHDAFATAVAEAAAVGRSKAGAGQPDLGGDRVAESATGDPAPAPRSPDEIINALQG